MLISLPRINFPKKKKKSYRKNHKTKTFPTFIDYHFSDENNSIALFCLTSFSVSSVPVFLLNYVVHVLCMCMCEHLLTFINTREEIETYRWSIKTKEKKKYKTFDKHKHIRIAHEEEEKKKQ